MKFSEMGLKREILDALDDIGLVEPTPIQKNAIPHVLSGEDVIGQAHTGTGKTFAFALPIIQKTDPDERGVSALIIVPTRELAIQVREEIKKASKHVGVKSIAVYGGTGLQMQMDSLKWGQQIVVATPGRLLDFFKRGAIRFDKIKFVVLDEADRMLDMGFIDDIKFVLNNVPKDRQTLLFSATMPDDIVKISERYMRSPVKILLDKDELSVELIDQTYLVVDERRKLDHLTEMLKSMKGKVIVFCSRKFTTRRLSHDLYVRGFRTVAIHGDLDQRQRETALARFKEGRAHILVATDVAARGIDIPRVEQVINYDVPMDPLMYFHRIGRTARAGESGKALTLVSQHEYDDFQSILQHTEVYIKRLNEEMGIKVEQQREHRPKEFGGRKFGGPRRYGGHSGHRSFGHGGRNESEDRRGPRRPFRRGPSGAGRRYSRASNG